VYGGKGYSCEEVELMYKANSSKYLILSKLHPIVLILIWFIVPASLNAGQVIITSLPDTVFQANHSASAVDTITLAGTKLTSGSKGLLLSGSYANPLNGWYINLGSDTIVFATDSLGVTATAKAQGSWGLRIVGHVGSAAPIYSQNIVVNGGTIICGATHRADSIWSFNNVCLSIGAEDVYVHNTNLIADGWNGKCFTGSGYEVEIDGGRYASNVTHYTSRCLFDGIMVNFEAKYDSAVAFAQPEPYAYNLKIHGISMSGTPHVGIRTDGGAYPEFGIYKIYACSIQVDSRNDTYTSYSGTCYSSANPYGIAVQMLGPGSEIYDNVITSGTNHNGGRGMLIEGSRGTASSYVKIHDNYIDVHEGPNAEYDEDHAENHAMRVRNDGIYTHIYNNTIINTGDNNTSTSAYAKSISGLRYSFGGMGRETVSHTIIENNVVKCTSLTSGVTSYVMCYDEVTVPDTSLIVRYNQIEGDNILVKYGEVNLGAKGITMYGDTYSFLSPTHSPQTFVVGHFNNNWDCSGNFVRDAIYENGTSDTNIIFTTTTSATLQLGQQRTLSIKVNGNNGLPVAGASVWCINAYGDTALAGVTDANGYVNGAVTYWWEANRTTDSTAYNYFTLKAKKGSDSTSTLHSVSATSTAPTLILSNTGGEVNEDTTAPSQIINLGALPGTADGDARLTWTAPGDDAASGTASQYDIRYSTATISSANWNSATQVSGEPSPKATGNSESFLVSGLQSGTTYYFAIKAADEVPNWSELSNVPSIIAPDKLAPGPIADLQAGPGYNAGEVVLDWTAPGDDGSVGTVASYEIRYSINTINESNWSSATRYNGSPTPLAAGSEQTFLMTGLYPGRTYYYAIKSSDEANNLSSLSNIATGKAQSGLSTGDDIVVTGLSPDSGEVLYTSRPTFAVENIDTASSNVYYFEIATDTFFLTPAVSSPAVSQDQSGQTSWQTETRLDSDVIYYWRARANDFSFSPGISFMVRIEPHCYPNPFKPNVSENVTFTEIPAGSNLVIMSVSGSKIRRWVSTDGDSIQWDGTNEEGNPVSSGAYLWYIEGTDIKGKLILIR
jgi:hypothetical protein